MKKQVKYETGIIKSSAFGFERDDCTVRALANSTALTYEEAHAHMKSFGRIDKRGMNTFTIRKALNGLKDYSVNEINTWEQKWNSNWKTIKQFISDNPVGKFYICVKGHALVIDNGKVVDHNLTGVRARVRFAAEIIGNNGPVVRADEAEYQQWLSEKENEMKPTETSIEAKAQLQKAKRKARRLARKAKAAQAAKEATFVAQFAAHSTAEAMAEALAS